MGGRRGTRGGAAASRTTTQRGLGAEHQGGREAALRALRDGDLCARCLLRGVEHPMYESQVHYVNGKARSSVLDYDDFPGRWFGGPQVKRLSYRSCNRSAGARFGNGLRAVRRAAVVYNRW